MDQFTIAFAQVWPLVVFITGIVSYIAYRVGLARGRRG